jgi:hypothetical protein
MQAKWKIPVWGAVCGGWLCAFLPLFLNARSARFFPRALPASLPVGVDLRMMLDYSRSWLETGNPYAALNPYPPLAAVVFAPLTALPFPVAYVLMTVATLVAFLSVTVVLPLRVFPQADRAAVWAVALTGFCSYGLWFEIRWGQFNVLALACAAWGLFVFHRGTGRWARAAAYGLFSAAIQLKVFPAIFVWAFAKDARAWRENLARWAALGAANVALLLALGPRVFVDFGDSLKAQAIAPYVWAGNHSIQSFAAWAGRPEIAPALFALLAVCGCAALVRAARGGGRSEFAGLLLMCALGAMLVPGVSHDYKLTTFPMAFAFFVAAAEPMPLRGFRGIFAAGLFLGLGFLEAWTLFSFAAKPAWAQNNAPFLLASCVALALRPGTGARRET